MYNDMHGVIYSDSSKKWQSSEISNGIAARCVSTLRDATSLVHRWNARHIK